MSSTRHYYSLYLNEACISDAKMENVLRDCAERLISAANSIVSIPAGQTPTSTPVSGGTNVPANCASNTSTPSSAIPVSSGISIPVAPHVPAALGVQTPTSSSALEEHRRLFGYRPPAATSRSRQSHVSRAASANYTSVRNITTPYSKKILKKNTFTKAFVCLSKVNQRSPPNAAERIRLSLAGLGEQKVTFLKNGNSSHVHEKLLETFPSLLAGGGYEILRTSDGNSKILIDVPCPPMGYDVNFLRSALGQAKGFLRPLQQDIKLNDNEVTQVLYTSAIVCWYAFTIGHGAI